MPTYDFKCRVCGYEFEKTQGMNDPNPTCPKGVYGLKAKTEDPREKALESFDTPCGGPTDKLITHSSFVLKGGGWASDGYGGGSR